MRFLADGMLGKLTRWLRIIGQDVIYCANFSDSKLLNLAGEDNRVVLTRDFELYKRAVGADVEALYLEGKTGSELLAEVAKKYTLELTVDMDKSSCPKCNAPLKMVPKESLIAELKTNTFKYYEKFWKCSNCGQIYWQGAHWKQINDALNQVQVKLQGTKKER